MKSALNCKYINFLLIIEISYVNYTIARYIMADNINMCAG